MAAGGLIWLWQDDDEPDPPLPPVILPGPGMPTQIELNRPNPFTVKRLCGLAAIGGAFRYVRISERSTQSPG